MFNTFFKYFCLSLLLKGSASSDLDICSNSSVSQDLHPNFDPAQLKARPCNYLLETRWPRRLMGRSTIELAAVYGYNIEKHFVTTIDGYILELHRISISSSANGRPILLVHRFLMSSREFFINCDRRAVAVRLADEGHDVWLINTRGTSYSRHVHLHRRQGAFRNFSLDEIIKYDLTSTINYILNCTGQNQLNWLEYPGGYSTVLGLLSSRPEFNSKVNLGFIIGELTNEKMKTRLVFRHLVPFHRNIEKIRTRYFKGTILSRRELLTSYIFMPRICRSKIFGWICHNMITTLQGDDPEQMDMRIIATNLEAYPGPGSIKQMTQWFQWIESGQFRHYDFGPDANLIYYKNPTPPIYNLSLVTSQIFNFWSLGDQFNVPDTVEPLENKYFHQIQINSSTFNHINFLLGRDADFYVYDKIINILKCHE